MYIGIDCGTSGIKALLVDAEGAPVGEASAPLEAFRPHPGWSEQDPDDWLRATGTALDQLARDHDLAPVRGLSLAGQMHGATVLGADDKPLRPCMLWNDVRAHEEAARLDADPRFRDLSGNIVFPGFTAPKVSWLREHEPDVFAAIRSVLLPKDFVRLWLTGEKASDVSDASGTSWLDVAKRAWSSTLIEASGADPAWLPRTVEGTGATGTIRPDLAQRWGMGSVTVAGGAGDNAGAACGTGVVRGGTAFLSLGTSGVLFVANDRYRPNAASAVHAFCHALPDRWHQMAVILAATDSLNWLARVMKADAGALVGVVTSDIAPRDPLFLPYLGGERTPHNSAELRGALVGLAHETDRASLARAVMEGVAHAFRDGLDALREAGTTIERATAVGGGSRSTVWLQIMADTLGIAIDVPAKGEFGGALGAARLAMCCVEGADPVAVCAAPKIAQTFEPRAERHKVQNERHEQYRALYRAVSGKAMSGKGGTT